MVLEVSELIFGSGLFLGGSLCNCKSFRGGEWICDG